MARKSITVKEDSDKEKARIQAEFEQSQIRLQEEFERSQSRIKELEETLRLAQEEELAIVENAEKKINDTCKEINMFCGVILSPEDLASVVILAVQTGGNVKIPFKLYFNEF